MTVLPAAIIGFAGLTDGIGPTGWQGLAELLGWFIACLAAAASLAFLLRQGSRVSTPAYVFVLATVAAIGWLAYELIDWIGLGAPTSAKAHFTSSMQALGSLGSGIFALMIASGIWKVNRH